MRTLLKTILPILTLCICTSYANAQKIEIPAGVTYKYADDKTNQKAKTLLDKELSGKCSYDLFNGGSLIIGPRLWQRLSQTDSIRDIEAGHTSFHVPILDDNGKPKSEQVLDGKLIQTKADFRKLWNHLRAEFSGSKLTYRKLTPAELKYYWAIISFDIEEPILIIEGGNYKLLVNFTKDNMKVMWLDEVY